MSDFIRRYRKGILAVLGAVATALTGVNVDDPSWWVMSLPALVSALLVIAFPNQPDTPVGPTALAYAEAAYATYAKGIRSTGHAELTPWAQLTSNERATWIQVAQVAAARLQLDESGTIYQK